MPAGGLRMLKAREGFVDTSFLLAVGNARDRHHTAATRLSEELETQGVALITTEYVLIEIGDTLSRLGQRRIAERVIRGVLDGRGIELVSGSAQLLQIGFELFIDRDDKEWGLTDCIPFEVMRRRAITLALTVDRHFVQAGFDAPLLAQT